jgi:hypothetical protein
MFDEVSIRRNGVAHRGRRYLRMQGGAAFQSIFYGGHCRVDPVGYARFAADDPGMNRLAARMLAELVEEAVTRSSK